MNFEQQHDFFNKKDIDRFEWQTQNKYISIKEKKVLSSILQFNGKKILDVGCAEGQDIKNIGEYKNRYFGIDFAQNKIDFASVNVEGKFICCDAKKLPYPNKTFDVVFARDLLHHVIEKDMVIKEIKRVCKRRGTIIIIEANGDNAIMKIWGNYMPVERDVLNSTRNNIMNLLKGEMVELDYEEPFPFYRVAFHYKYGFSFLGNVTFLFPLYDFIVYLFSKIIIKEKWGYIIYKYELGDDDNEMPNL